MIPRYNQAPGQNAQIVLEENGSHHLRMMHWGVQLNGGGKANSRLINVRSESILERRAFTGKIMSRLCIVPATGFYEWASLSSSVAKQPYHIALLSGDLFGFAGICQYEQARSNATIPNFAIITKAANGGKPRKLL